MDARARDAAEADSPEARITALLEGEAAARRLGSPRRAQTFLEQARLEAPDDPELLERLLEALGERGDHEGACAVLEAERRRVGEDDPRFAELTLRLAATRIDALGELARGRALLEAAAR